MNPFCTFMASTAGRLIRIVAGLALMGWGAVLQGTVGILLAVIGVIPLLAGLLDYCLLAPLFGCPMSGERIRGGRAHPA